MVARRERQRAGLEGRSDRVSKQKDKNGGLAADLEGYLVWAIVSVCIIHDHTPAPVGFGLTSYLAAERYLH